MAYATSNPPRLVGQAVAGMREWHYVSTDAMADVDADGYITNAEDLGMAVGDFVKVFDTTNGIISGHRVAAINANGSADLGNGTTIGTATDSD